MYPLHVAAPVCPPLRAGEKQELDFEVASAAVMLDSINLQPCDERRSAIPGAVTMMFGSMVILVF